MILMLYGLTPTGKKLVWKNNIHLLITTTIGHTWARLDAKLGVRSGFTDAILMDIGAAHWATGKSGRSDRILIKAPYANNSTSGKSKLRKALPRGPCC